MVEVDFSGNFTNEDNCKENAIVTFIDEGTLKDGKFGKQLMIGVDTGDKQLVHGVKNAEGQSLQKAFGKNTAQWVGQQAKVTHIPYVKDDQIKKKVVLVPIGPKA